MKDKKQVIRNIILFILLVLITFIVIFNNHDLNKTIKLIFTVKLRYIILGIIMMFTYFSIESLNIKQVLKSLGDNVKFLKCLKYTLIGFFFSGITPAATGGQPMEIYYMNKEGISPTHSTIALLIELCSFQIVTISCGIIGAIINHELLSSSFILVFIIGLLLNGISLTVMSIGLFSKKISTKLVNLFIKILSKLKYSKLSDIEKSINDALSDYHKGSNYIKQHKSIFLKSIIIVFGQVIFFYLVPFFVYKSFDLTGTNIFKIMTMQALLFISSSSIPLPGSVGVSESIFLRIYTSIFGTELLASAMLLNRGITFYLFMFIGLLINFYTILKLKKKK